MLPRILLGTLCLVSVAACSVERVVAPGPPIDTPVRVRFTVLGGTVGGCQPNIGVSMAGPVGSRITWAGMGFHVAWTPEFDQDFDAAFAQRFWGGDGIRVGETESANSAGFSGPFPVAIRIRFKYTLNGTPGIYADSVSLVCQ